MVMVVEMQKAVRQAEIEFQDSMLRIVSKLVRVQPTANDAQIRIQLVQLLGLTYDHVTVEAALLAARAQQDEDEESRVSLLIQEAYDKQEAEENRTKAPPSSPGDIPVRRHFVRRHRRGRRRDRPGDRRRSGDRSRRRPHSGDAGGAAH